MFFGRVGETEELAELLHSLAEQAKAATLLVVGPSGCGKSSVVRAGLLHVMAKEPGWLTLSSICRASIQSQRWPGNWPPRRGEAA